MNRHALVVLSGGQDSTYCAAWAKLNYSHVSALTFDYEQRHGREIEAARTVAKLLEIPHSVITLGPILQSSSPLTNKGRGLEQYESPEQMAEVIGKRIEKTFVPMRNALFLTIAVNRAIAIDPECAVVTGVCQDDNANYPDCTARFIEEFELMCDAATGRSSGATLIQAPLLLKAKTAQIVEMFDMQAEALYAFTHTSYAGDYPPLDRNHASVLREAAFRDAGYPDPLIIRANMEGLMELPDADNYKDVVLMEKLRTRILQFKERLDDLARVEA